MEETASDYKLCSVLWRGILNKVNFTKLQELCQSHQKKNFRSKPVARIVYHTHNFDPSILTHIH
jgi:hypothetical protein